MKNTLGYATDARVSLPVLNPKTPINFGFDSFRLMDKHNDMRAMVREMHFSEERSSFGVLNIGGQHFCPFQPGKTRLLGRDSSLPTCAPSKPSHSAS